MSEQTTHDEGPLAYASIPWESKKFLEDAIEVINSQLSQPGRSLKSIKVAATYYPEGRMEATESYPRPPKAKVSA